LPKDQSTPSPANNPLVVTGNAETMAAIETKAEETALLAQLPATGGKQSHCGRLLLANR